jgi:hypothetical protein
MKAMILAALASLSLGAGIANAQSYGGAKPPHYGQPYSQGR